MYLYHFLAKNVRHFGIGPLAASSTNYIVLDFWYVVEEVMSFHLVYNLLLLQFVLGYPPFEHRSPGLLIVLSNRYNFSPFMENRSRCEHDGI